MWAWQKWLGFAISLFLSACQREIKNNSCTWTPCSFPKCPFKWCHLVKRKWCHQYQLDSAWWLILQGHIFSYEINLSYKVCAIIFAAVRTLICRLNMGVKFLKYDKVKNCWLGVEETDNACPISSLMQTVFRDIEVILRKYSPILLVICW